MRTVTGGGKKAMRHPSSLVQRRRCANCRQAMSGDSLCTKMSELLSSRGCAVTPSRNRADAQASSAAPTQSGSVLADEPAVVGEKRSKADWEHGGREEEEEDVELRLSVWESVLRGKQQPDNQDNCTKTERTLRNCERDFFWSVLGELINLFLLQCH